MGKKDEDTDNAGDRTTQEEEYEIEIQSESLTSMKRQSFKSLPPSLIFGLKRFDFDFEIMDQVKLNDYFPFPMNLNMYPYTINGRSDKIDSGDEVDSDQENENQEKLLQEDDCWFQLSGVVIHNGSAQQGHYYSYIKERNQFEEVKDANDISKTGNQPQWLEFNDTYVGPINPHDKFRLFWWRREKLLRETSSETKCFYVSVFPYRE